MEFCFFFKSMYVHESEKKKYFLIMGGWTVFLFSFFFGNFFQQVKKLLNFWDAVNIKVAKFKLDHLRFYCKSDFFDRKIRKIRNWNQRWALIGGTTCTSCCYTKIFEWNSKFWFTVRWSKVVAWVLFKQKNPTHSMGDIWKKILYYSVRTAFKLDDGGWSGKT